RRTIRLAAVRRVQSGERWVPVAAELAAALFSLSASASASVTLGQLSNTPSGSTCGNQLDFAQLSVAFGNPYVVPGTGMITSWTTFEAGPSHQRTFKVFRKVSDPSRYIAVGHDGPRDLTGRGTAANTLPRNHR